MEPLRIAGVGCGSRTSTYMRLASQMPERYEIVGAADPIAWKVDRIARLSGREDFRSFTDARQLLSVDKFADVLIIGTQDSYHVEPCVAALEKGYDVLLEKPIGTNLPDVLRLEAVAKRLGRRVLICHVLRYTPFYRKVKQIIDGGELGEIITLQASEGVGTFHQAHSFVRGHWGITRTSSPMIIQKSCHDLDIIQWLVGRPFTAVSSFGQNTLFNRQHLPQGAPPRCTDGCPVGATCQYNAMRYLTDQRAWLPYVYNGGEEANDEDVRAWLKTSDWGRCVYQCGNTAVDHQVLSMQFAGGATATFTMSAFDVGRNIEVWGTEGVLRGGTYTKQVAGCDIVLRNHASGKTSHVTVEPRAGGYEGHGGGDRGLMEAMYDEMRTADPDDMRSSLSASVQSHVMGFAAEASRATARIVTAEAYPGQPAQGR